MGSNLGETNDVIYGGTDGTGIGNIADRLKIDGAEGTPPTISRTDFSGTATSTSNTGTLETKGFGCISFQVEVTAVSGTSPTLDVELQSSEDGSIWSPFQTTERFSATGSNRISRVAVGGRYYRFVYTIGGTLPSFTFNIKTTLKNYLPIGTSGLIRYANVDLTAVNNVSTVFNARGGANISLMSVRADDGGSNAQYVVQVSMDNLNWDVITGNITQARATTVTQNFPSYAFRYWRIKVTSAANAGTRVLDVFWHANGGS